MSRIYEALQKAAFAQKAGQKTTAEPVAEPVAVSAIEEPPPAKADVVLENIAQHSWNPSIASFPTLAESGGGVEQFRRLRSRIYQAHYEAPMKTILIASGMPSEGKSFVAANLAMSLARNTVNNILLIDGDLRRPTLHNLLGTTNTPGLSEYLAGEAVLIDIMQRDSNLRTTENAGVGSVSNLTFIPSGKCGDHSSELVANHRIEELIAAVSPHFNWIIIDSAPVLAVTDSVELARATDAVLLVARGASTPYDVAQRAQATFSGRRILGFVLNDAKNIPRRGSYYSSYYYYGGKEAPAEPKK
jgi:capsular exopolysaccharide synthesis family protein